MAKASKLMCGEEMHAKKKKERKEGVKRNRGREGRRAEKWKEGMIKSEYSM